MSGAKPAAPAGAAASAGARDVYKEIGFDAQKVGFGERPGILVVDFQLGFVAPEFPLGGWPLVDRAIENTVTLLDRGRAAGLPVACCYTAFGSARDAPYWKIAELAETFHEGTPQVALDPRIHDPDYDLVLRKTGPSIFFNTPLAQFLTKERVDTVIVTGCNTSGCIRATVLDAFSHGFRTIVPEPCVGDVEEGPHIDNLRDIGRRYADVVTLEETLAYLDTIAS